MFAIFNMFLCDLDIFCSMFFPFFFAQSSDVAIIVHGRAGCYFYHKRKEFFWKIFVYINIPQPGRLVPTPGQNPGLVPVEQRTGNSAVMLHGLTDGGAVGGIPQPDRLVPTPGQNPVPVPVEQRTGNMAVMLQYGI